MVRLILALLLMLSLPLAGLANGYSSGGGPTTGKLTTADAFSDWLVSGGVPTTAGSFVSTGGSHFATDVVLSLDEAYAYMLGFDTASDTYIRLIKVRLSDNTVVATQTFSDALQVATDMRLSADGTTLYFVGWVDNTSGSTLYKISTTDLSISDSELIGAVGYIGYDSRSGGIDLSPDGTYVFALLNDTGTGDFHIVKCDASTLAVSSDVNKGATVSYLSIAALDNTHVVSVDVSTGPAAELVSIAVPGGTVSNVLALTYPDMTGVAYIKRVGSGDDFIITGPTNAFADGYVNGVSDVSGTPVEDPVLITGDRFNTIGLDGTTAWLGSSSANDPVSVVPYTLGGGAVGSALTIDNPDGLELYGVAPLAGGSIVYAGVGSGTTDLAIFRGPSLTATTPAAVAYVDGTRVTPSSESHTYTASKDTYVSINSDGTYTYQAVNNSDPAPAITGLAVAKVVSDGSAVTGVTQLASNAPRLLPLSGQATLAAGTIDVSIPDIATSDRVLIQRVSGTAANFGHLTYTITAGDKITINSDNVADDSVVNYFIFR